MLRADKVIDFYEKAGYNVYRLSLLGKNMDADKKKAWTLHKQLKPIFPTLSYCAVLYALRKNLKQKDTEELIRKLAVVASKRRKNRRRKKRNDYSAGK